MKITSVKVSITDETGKEHNLGMKDDPGRPEMMDRLIDALFSTVKAKIRQLRQDIDEPWPEHL